MHGNPEVGRWGGLMWIYLPLSSSLCLCLPNRSGYSYQADTRAALRSMYWFPKMAPLYVFFLFSCSNQSNPLRWARHADLQLCICKLGYRDDSHTGEKTEQSVTGVFRMASADNNANEKQGSFVPSEVETMLAEAVIWRNNYIEIIFDTGVQMDHKTMFGYV